MGIEGVSTAERMLRKLLAPLCVLSGIVVVSGFFFPELVGETISGRAWLTISLVFFASGLSYLAVLPTASDEREQAFDSDYLLRVRRLEVGDVLEGFLDRQDPVTVGVPVLAFGLFFLGQLLLPSTTMAVVAATQAAVTTYAGWLFSGIVLLAVAFCLALLVGPWGSVRLGGSDVEPAYTYPVYFTMVFTAGIAAGIVFWGPAEALFHYETPPSYFEVEPQSEEAAGAALTYALFHWGFWAWSVYIAVGVPIAYYVYQQDAPLRVSTILTPFLGVDNLDSVWCRLVDLLAVFATIGGIATSIALVGDQFLTGIDVQWGVGFGVAESVLFVAGLTFVFVVSAQSGVHRGIRRIAGVNVVLFGLFAALFFAVAPRTVVVESSVHAVGSYARHAVPMSLHLGNGLVADRWVADWTIWNWAWWFSWAPFAGLFLAALSRGRRIRTVVLTGFVATSLATIVWFLLLGSTSLHLQQTSTVDALAAIDAHGRSEAVAGFPVFEAFSIGQLLVFVFLALIVVFMATSADTSTLVVAVLATRREFAPTTGAILFWGIFQGVVAISVLVTDSAELLQAMAVLTGAPFALLALIALVGLAGTLRERERGRRSIVVAIRSRLSENRENDER
ncbi:BCCT family transporter [Natronobacterium gregoryi]|uniref:Choline-glycine betaine transporter n=2 Tax=Natronobacterium gregoryi TaxID=44930 RepID=L0ALX7_NATGS|nr:BCCT family transporter [Natronobacterium gregoryi]AFZ74055.1 choline-glycine betaine transporter [Natronobacterium gregoryi SP2]ELY70357.1 glycine betaine transporter BetL [Natronobacterium gregoryi SP2]PLK20798.1 glycine/betaine ABC transporter [Natronobacterium gregoryi SP2]SFJ06657.1 Choline-glycine betaine transporter [Natronobacterium gregoryi]